MRQRLWRDAATTNGWLDRRLPAARSGRDDAVRGRRRAAGAQRGPSDADATMTSMRDLASATTDERDEFAAGASSNACAPRSPAWRRALRARARSATSPSRNSRTRGRAALHGARRRARVRPTRSACPARIPFTRGIHPTGYRGKLWTMRQFAGFGSARDTNERFKFLLEHGQTGLSDRVRFPDADGLRLRPSALGGRSRQDAASRSRASPTWRCCSTASRSTRSRRR